MSKFSLGRLVATAGVNNLMEDNKQFAKEVSLALGQYTNCDWGCVGEEDWKSNDEAVIDGERLLGAYETSEGKVWIITEWDRSVTTILFPSEY